MQGVTVTARLFGVDAQHEVLQAVGDAVRHAVQTQAGNVGKALLVHLANGSAALAFDCHMAQHHAAQGCLQFAHLAVDARQDDFVFILDAEVLEQVDVLLEIGVVHGQRPTLGGVEQFGGVETEHGGVAIGSDGTAVDLRSKGVCTVVHHAQAMVLSDGAQCVHVTGHAVHMHAQNAGGAGGDEGCHAGRGNAECFGVNVSKHGGDAVPAEHMRCGRKGEGGGDDFTREAQRLAGHDQGDGAVVEKTEVGGTKPFSEFRF